MDQVRKILGWLKAQHFWVLCGLICLIALYCWWSGSGTLSAAFQTNKSQIEQGFTALSGVQSESFHPNDDIQKKQVEETTKQAQNVAAIWEGLYDRQKEGVLVWPAALREDFIDYIDKREFGSDIDRKYRAVYQNYIQNHFPKLPESIDAKPIPEGDVAAGGAGFSREMMGPEGGMMTSPSGMPLLVEDDSICEWDPADQAILRQQLEFQDQPSPLRIWVTQEDLWCYQTLLNVIKQTNTAAKATRKSNAAVRIVHSLEVGQRAAPFIRTPNRIYQVPAAASAAASQDGFSEMPAEPGMNPEGGASPMGAITFTPFGAPGDAQMSPEQEQTALLNWRYLGPDGKPVGGGGGGDAASPDAAVATGAAPTLDDLKTKEFRQLPVRMVMRMDLRYLPQFIGKCADQPLQVEVQEVRIFPADPASNTLGAVGDMNSSFGGAGGTGLFTGSTNSSGVQMFDAQPHIATVIVQGVIYIFNPPNPDLLKSDAEEQVVATP